MKDPLKGEFQHIEENMSDADITIEDLPLFAENKQIIESWLSLAAKSAQEDNTNFGEMGTVQFHISEWDFEYHPKFQSIFVYRPH